MRHITRACGLLALASCASVAPEPAVPAALQQYAEAAQFLLPGFHSVACYTLPLEPDAGSTATSGPRIVRVTRCGSDFEAPHGVGYGRYRGIEVYDYGSRGLDGETPTGERLTIGETPVWHYRHEMRPGHVVDAWIAHVDDRFVVISHHRELLEQALRRTGRLAQLLQPFAAVSALTGDAESAVFLLPRAGDETYWGRPVPIEPMAATLSASQRLRLYHRLPLPEQFTAWQDYANGPMVTASLDGWQLTTLDLRLDPTMRMVLLELLFGLAIFI